MCKHIFTPIAHRGGTEAAFENTIEAFADAYALGYRWFETDVQISKDGFLYAIHDSNLKNVTGQSCSFSGSTINVQSWKGFDIKHPNKEGHRLRHICLEGPEAGVYYRGCLLYTSPSPRDPKISRMPSSA